jgi:hypothetical protein
MREERKKDEPKQQALEEAGVRAFYYPLQNFYDLGKEGKMSKSKQGLVCTWLWLVRVIIFNSLVLSKFVTVTSLPGTFFYKLTTS